MKLIRSGSSGRIDDAPRSSSVRCGIIGGANREFLNRIDAEVPSQHASRAAVGIIIDADAVEAVIVLLWPRAGYR